VAGIRYILALAAVVAPTGRVRSPTGLPRAIRQRRNSDVLA
jgi:hypothetical protein